MEFSFSQFLLSSISFGVGYYIKARFEINQEKMIHQLQMQIEKIKQDDEKKLQKIKYQLWKEEQAHDRLKREHWDFKEQLKTGSFNSIPKVAEEKSSASKVLKSFL